MCHNNVLEASKVSLSEKKKAQQTLTLPTEQFGLNSYLDAHTHHCRCISDLPLELLSALPSSVQHSTLRAAEIT